MKKESIKCPIMLYFYYSIFTFYTTITAELFDGKIIFFLSNFSSTTCWIKNKHIKTTDIHTHSLSIVDHRSFNDATPTIQLAGYQCFGSLPVWTRFILYLITKTKITSQSFFE